MGQYDPQRDPKTSHPRTCVYAARKIVIFIQRGDTLSKKVMEDLSPEERMSVVDEGSSIVISFLKRAVGMCEASG